MLKKLSATLVAFVLALGLSIVVASPASAHGWPSHDDRSRNSSDSHRSDSNRGDSNRGDDRSKNSRDDGKRYDDAKKSSDTKNDSPKQSDKKQSDQKQWGNDKKQDSKKQSDKKDDSKQSDKKHDSKKDDKKKSDKDKKYDKDKKKDDKKKDDKKKDKGSRSCIPSSSVSYSYDRTTNSGVITVPAKSGSTGELCSPFWVTAASWKYLGDGTWAQKLENVHKLGKIATPGSYAFSAPVTCGQGDVYASFREDAATLDPTPYLYGPDNPFDEHFLHEMGFSGPKPTYVNSTLGCNEVVAAPVITQPNCTDDGSYSLPAVDHVRWLRDGVTIAAGDYSAPNGTSVTITAIADETWVLAGGTQDPKTNEWSRSWTFHFEGAGVCAAAQLIGSITAQCLNDVPILSYSVTLIDPSNQSTGDEAVLTLSDGSNSYVFDPALGTIHDGETLTGSRIWPGASVDADGNATGWPGWELDGTTWVETTGNYGWARGDGLTATISVNPDIVASVTYPPGDPNCITRPPLPPLDPPTLGLFPTNAQLAQQCTSDGRGVLTLGLVDGVSFFDDVNYFIDGAPATSATVYLNPGSYQVTVTTKNASDGLDGPTAWQVDVTGTGVCGDLTTLALTGFDAGYLAALAALLLAAGASIVVIRRVRTEA